MSDAHDSYFVALAAIRLRDLITGSRWPEPEDEFDMVLANALAGPSGSGGREDVDGAGPRPATPPGDYSRGAA